MEIGGKGGITGLRPRPSGRRRCHDVDLRRLGRLVDNFARSETGRAKHARRVKARDGFHQPHFDFLGFESDRTTNEKRPRKGTFLRLAEREGFEPSIRY